MIFVLSGLGVFLLGAIFSRRAASGYGLAAIGAALALAAGVGGLLGRSESLSVAFLGQLRLGIGVDRLSGAFLTISAIVWLLVALFAIRCGAGFRRATTIGFNIALVGMTLVVTALDAIILLVGWELMTAFVFLMLLERSRSERHPFAFLAFGELSTLALVIGFGALYAERHSLSLSATGGGSAVFLVFASLGMVIKMDIVPFHSWMRKAYEQLPGPIAAIASVSVTLMGVYGLERVMRMGDYLQWWTLVLIVAGAVSAFWGALHAASTKGLRSLPAYSTVESNGMILAAVGLSVIAAAGGSEELGYLALFALAAALVLAIGHAVAKSLFFLSLGHATEALKTTSIDETRGVWAAVGRVPALGIIVSGLSFAAFPPLVGYVGEWMLLETTFQAYKFTAFAERFVTAFVGVLVALAIGLTAFSMVKFIGYTVLGREKSARASAIASPWITAPQICLMLLVALAGVALPVVLPLFGFRGLFTGLLGVPKGLLLVSGMPTFGVVSPTMFAALIIVLSAIPLALWWSGRRALRRVDPWNGGIAVNASETFTSSAYSQILQAILKNFYRTREISAGSVRRLETIDLLARPFGALRRAFVRGGTELGRLVMNGRIAAYVLYIVVMFVIAVILARVP